MQTGGNFKAVRQVLWGSHNGPYILEIKIQFIFLVVRIPSQSRAFNVESSCPK